MSVGNNENETISCPVYSRTRTGVNDGHDAIFFGAVGWPEKVPDHISLWARLWRTPRVLSRADMRRAAGLLILMAGTLHAQSLADSILAAHNSVRRSVGVAPLVWSERLADFAREWADYLAMHHNFFHRRNSPYGENLFEITSASAAPAEVVKDWASESRDYQYRSNTCRGVCGHYTQIIWRDTKRVGCAAARGGRTEIWVCNYDPPGNFIGRRPY